MKTITLTIEVGPNDDNLDVLVIFDLAKYALRNGWIGNSLYNSNETSRGELTVKEK